MNSTLLESTKTPVEAFLRRVLRDGGPIAEEYPLVFDGRFAGELVSARDGDDVRSACAILVRDLLVDGTEVRVGFIGSVATAPEWRSRGMATAVLRAAEEALRARGCAASILWAEDPAFYVGRGYGPVGAEYDYALPFELIERLPVAPGVRERRASDAADIHLLYEQHSVRVLRTTEETGALLDCPGMTTLVIERAGRVVAYACLGRGKDFADVIHEWGGGAADVLALLRAHLEARRDAGVTADERVSALGAGLLLMAPTSARDLHLRLEHLGVPIARGMLGLGKVLDRVATANALTSLVEPHGRVVVDPAGGDMPFTVHGPRSAISIDDEGALGLLFGIAEVRPHVTAFLRRCGLEGARLPLEPFAWGLDSI